ncbi:MAG: tetratricopeptide repeat protein [Treponema sp.]|jgi:tetratricopeptide (TPR) repeat protein|nr:tetratricopeptide repeat protein [Treponema sp.]
MKLPILFLGFVTAALFSCASNPGLKKTSQGLYGMIYDGDNKPVREVKVYVGNKLSSVSDIHGHFSLAGLKTGKNYRVKALKDNYEETELEIYYTDPQNVLYINMSHRDQLLGQAERALREGDWALAASLLARAEALGSDYSPARYLRAALAFRRGEHKEALDILVKLEETEGNTPYVHLFIADLCQYFTGGSDRAAASLKKFLDLRYDPEIAERLQKLLETGLQD